MDGPTGLLLIPFAPFSVTSEDFKVTNLEQPGLILFYKF